MLKPIKKSIKKLKNVVVKNFAPIRWKEKNELDYWRARKLKEGTLNNQHYQYFYTEHFGIEKSFYKDKVILDLGCGPRGSLEWATKTKRNIGLDPLADEYLKLGASEHKMEYISAASEQIPLEDKVCDAIFSFNSLDHVENIEKTIREIKRILKPGGIFLLLVEVNHPPTDCEPHELNQRQLIDALKPEFTGKNIQLFKPVRHGIYESILENKTFAKPLDSTEIGYLSIKFEKLKIDKQHN